MQPRTVKAFSLKEPGHLGWDLSTEFHLGIRARGKQIAPRVPCLHITIFFVFKRLTTAWYNNLSQKQEINTETNIQRLRLALPSCLSPPPLKQQKVTENVKWLLETHVGGLIDLEIKLPLALGGKSFKFDM